MTDRPEVRLRPGKSPTRLRHGFPWAFDNELVLDRRTKKIVPGTIVDLLDADRGPLGTAAFNPNSKIAARMLDRKIGVPVDKDFLNGRLTHALALREKLFDAPFYRLVHAEGDGLPGLVIDRFGEALVIQPNAAWAEVHLDPLVEAARTVTGCATIIKNASGRARALEGLDTENALLTGSTGGPLPVPMNGATYMADLEGGQKTGLFYDQRLNHAFAARLARGARVLDVFSHVGGFGLAALAGGAVSALAVDGSAAALTLAEEGAHRSGFSDRFGTRTGDAFAVMNELAAEKARFDLVICDPPAFAPARQALKAGLRAYEKTARQGAALVEPGGVLVLCSCSHAADLDAFRAASLRGVGKAGRVAQVLHTGFAGPDHPVHAMLAETAYLKSIFLRLT